LWELKQIVTSDGIADKDRAGARRYVKMYLDGLSQAKTALPRWETTLPKVAKQRLLTGEAVDLLDTMMADMTKAAGELGVKLR